LASGAVFGTVRAGADPSGGWATSWDSLASSIGGPVLVPSSGSSFTMGKQVFNALYNGLAPAAVVAVTSQQDVKKAVSFAVANKLTIAPRGARPARVAGRGEF
jgi:hypothetical protein